MRKQCVPVNRLDIIIIGVRLRSCVAVAGKPGTARSGICVRAPVLRVRRRIGTGAYFSKSRLQDGES